jgi:hypothetical protein
MMVRDYSGHTFIESSEYCGLSQDCSFFASLYTVSVFQNRSSLIAFLFDFLGVSLSKIEPRPFHSLFPESVAGGAVHAFELDHSFATISPHSQAQSSF